MYSRSSCRSVDWNKPVNLWFEYPIRRSSCSWFKADGWRKGRLGVRQWLLGSFFRSTRPNLWCQTVNRRGSHFNDILTLFTPKFFSFIKRPFKVFFKSRGFHPPTGESLPDLGEFIPQLGEPTPQPGESLPNLGAFTPQQGESFPQPGESLPDLGEFIPHLGEPIPQPEEGFPRIKTR